MKHHKTAKRNTRRWVRVTRKQMALDFLRDAAKALKFAEANPDLADYGLRVAAMRAHAAGWLLSPETKVQP